MEGVATKEAGVETYVQPFPEGGRRVMVSNNGGGKIHWRGDGKELFYVQGWALMSLAVSTEGEFSAGPPVPLFEDPDPSRDFPLNYDVSVDGKRFLVRAPSEETGKSDPEQKSIHVVQNWYEEFRNRDREQD
jgi:hypothetical protein